MQLPLLQSDSCDLLGDIEPQRLAALSPSPLTQMGGGGGGVHGGM